VKNLIKQQVLLPDTIDKLQEFVLIGKQKLIACKAHLKAIEDVNLGISVYDQKLQETQDLAGVVLMAEAKMGELLENIPLKRNKEGSTKGTSLPSLPPNITRKQSHYAQALSKNIDVIEDVIKEAIEKKEVPRRSDVLSKIASPHVTKSTGENEWYTPEKYINAARSVMGDIDVDPASSDIANQIVKAKKYYTINDNGLTKPWSGRVWMNPPYSQPLINEFSQTFVDKYNSGEIKEACVLTNNATETIWLQVLLSICDQVCFIKGRIKFIDVKGMTRLSPLQGQLILYFGKNVAVFYNYFNVFGIIK